MNLEPLGFGRLSDYIYINYLASESKAIIFLWLLASNNLLLLYYVFDTSCLPSDNVPRGPHFTTTVESRPVTVICCCVILLPLSFQFSLTFVLCLFVQT